MDVGKLMKQMMENYFQTLSAIFDANGGTVVIDKKVFENADIKYYVTAEEDGDKIILKKVEGKSELYHEIFPPKN